MEPNLCEVGFYSGRAKTGMGHLVRWLQKTAVPLSLPALLAVCGAVRAQAIQPPSGPDTAATPVGAPASPVGSASGEPASQAEPPFGEAGQQPDPAAGAAGTQSARPTDEPANQQSQATASSHGQQPPPSAADPGQPPQSPTGEPGQQPQLPAGEAVQPPKSSTGEPGKQSEQNVPYHWLDRTRDTLYDTMWHSAEHVDRWFGSATDDAVYRQAYGSISPALLYTQYNGLRAQVRFNLNFPLPQVNDRIHAFVGRFDPNEFVSERNEPSGTLPRTYGPPTEDQTLLGIGYHQPDKQGSHFDAGAGIRLSLPMDPYIKGSYIFERGQSDKGLFSVRETLFWQNSEGAGETTRLDLERVFARQVLVRYTLSGTRSQKSAGLKGYSSILVLHGLPNRRAVAFEVGMDGATQAQVPLHDYGAKAAYRQCFLRRWLIMEVRTSVDWPKDFTWQHRHASLGLGVGFEMLLGTDEFLARPITF